jgi:CheY-like chemotaxis protein
MKILLVDDSKSARYALRLQLQRYGMAVETEDAAETALERVRDTPPDAIFMDHTMPGMNGFEALDILKSTPATKHIPVVMCTSNEDSEFIAQARKKGAVDILSKSTAPEKLEALLERLQVAVTAPAPAAAVAESGPAYQPALPEADGTVPTQEQLAEGVLARVRPLLDQHAKTLAADLVARTDERLDMRVRTAIGPIVDELSDRLSAELFAKTDEKLISRLGEEADRLQKNFIKAQSEQAQLTTNRLINEILPQVVRQQLEHEQQNIAHMVQDLIDGSLDSLVEEPAFIRRVLGNFEAAATTSAEQIVKRQAQAIAESVASERAGEVADRLMQTSRPDQGPMYLLAGAAALVGVASSAVVFFLLS